MTDRTMDINVIIGLNGHSRGLSITIKHDFIQRLIDTVDIDEVEDTLKTILKTTVQNLTDEIVDNIKINEEHRIVVQNGK